MALRPLGPADPPLIGSYAMEAPTSVRVLPYRESGNPDELARVLGHGVGPQWVSEQGADRPPLALLQLVELDLRSGVASLSVQLAPALGGESARAMVARDVDDFLRRVSLTYPFRHFYWPLLQAWQPRLEPLMPPGMAEEARLAEHQFYDGGYADLIIYSASAALDAA